MSKKILLSQLSLVYSPISNYNFHLLANDKEVQRALIRCDNIYITKDQKTISFEIRKQQNSHVLKCKMPIFQKIITIETKGDIALYHKPHQKYPHQTSFPLNNIDRINLVIRKPKEEEEFLIWLTPEKFLFLWWHNVLEATIEDDYRSFTKYKIHYVGESTEQGANSRLLSHKNLQKILSVEDPLSDGASITHELVLLMFEFKDNTQMQFTGGQSDYEDIINGLLGLNQPSEETIFLDAEKAFVKAMSPKHNNVKFKGYPKGDNGLYKYNYDSISYTLSDPITLVYDNGEIEGGLTEFGGDTIFVKDGKNLEVYKMEDK